MGQKTARKNAGKTIGLRDFYGEAHSLSQSRQLSQNSQQPLWKIGTPYIDGHLPATGLALNAIHELEAINAQNTSSLTGFTLGLLTQLRSSKPIIWCHAERYSREYAHPYWLGLSRFGISADRLVFVRLKHERDLPFALEEALKTKGIAAVIGEGTRPDFTGSRRLSFLTQKQNTPCLLVSDGNNNPLGSAAHTRWHIAPLQGPENPHDPSGPSLPSWRLALTRARGGRAIPFEPSQFQDSDLANSKETSSHKAFKHSPRRSPQDPWRIVWDEETHSFCSFSTFASRTFSKTTNNTSNQPRNTMVG